MILPQALVNKPHPGLAPELTMSNPLILFLVSYIIINESQLEDAEYDPNSN